MRDDPVVLWRRLPKALQSDLGESVLACALAQRELLLEPGTPARRDGCVTALMEHQYACDAALTWLDEHKDVRRDGDGLGS